LLIGTIQRERGNLQQVASAWGDVLKHEPDAENLQVPAVDFFFEYGQVLLAIGESDLAVEYLERSLALGERPETLIQLGEARAQSGDPESAETAFRRALELSPEAIGARTGLAQLELSRGDPGAALDWLMPHITPLRADVESAFLLQRIYVQLDNEEAAEQWRAVADRLRKENLVQDTAAQVLRDYPETQWAAVLRAYRFAEEGNWTEAERILAPLVPHAQDQQFVQDLYSAIQSRGALPSLEQLPTTHY
jgi:tetratricopeptide (TPR) repeat protein